MDMHFAQGVMGLDALDLGVALLLVGGATFMHFLHEFRKVSANATDDFLLAEMKDGRIDRRQSFASVGPPQKADCRIIIVGNGELNYSKRPSDGYCAEKQYRNDVIS
ncbi:MAG: hypothetical protein HQL42_09680 [Alphaproteobacteria bacterium]|nr:hypothetical protein [Alphaproteobacteria bacterium]